MLDFEHFENLVQSIGKYSFAEELVDIVNADLTFTLFFFLGVMTGYKQIFGDPIHCMPPAAYTKWEDYYNSYCYIQSKIIIQSMHPHSFNRNIKTDPDLEQLVYYQWVPYVFMLMAILFRVPRMFWTTFARFFCYGEDIGSFIEDCNTIKEKTKPKERAKAISKLAEFICRTMNMRSRRSLFGQSMAVFCVLRKLLAVIIVLSQFLLLCYLIPSRFNLLWGFELLTYKWTTMEHSLEGIEGVFPTLVRCDVSQMVSSNFTGKEVVQDANYVMFKLKMPCVLMQNFIIEKMFAFVYFWLLVILVVNVGSLLKKMMILVWPQHRYRMANQHLSNRERLSDAYKEATGVGANSAQLEWQRRQFIDKALSADGILMFNFLRARVGSFLAQDLIVELWKAYAKPTFQTADCVSEQSIVSVRITDKRNSDADAATEEETMRLVAYTLNDRITLFDVAPSAPPTEEMAARQMNMFEKLANLGGAIYRHQKAQFPRRLAILKGVWKHELAPPKQADWPAIKADFAKVVKAIETKAYSKLSVREGLVYSAVFLEVLAWFFVGEMIGRRYIFGYIVPSDYVSKTTRTQVKELKKAQEI